jgi:hypothetical protein
MLYAALSLAARMMGAQRRPLAERSNNMIEIPPVPEGIANPSNLYNDVYSELPPLAWANPEFHDKLAWILESDKDARVSMWHFTTSSALSSTIRASTMCRIQVASVGVDADVRTIWRMPEVIAYQLKREVLPDAPIPQMKPYPGFAARNPSTDSPVGAAWPDHPWKGRKMFRDVGGDRFAIGAEWETPEYRFAKRNCQITSGSGPFGQGGKMETAWEIVYSR